MLHSLMKRGVKLGALAGLALAMITPVQAAVTTVEAETLYREHCAVCHGDKGDGQTRARYGLNPQPRDFTDPSAGAELTRSRMMASVTHGRKNTAMVAWKDRLTAAEIEALVDYIRDHFMILAPDPELLKARSPKLERGRLIYEDQCRVCHGDKGNGSTWTRSVLDPSPRNFTSPQSRRLLTRSRMIASVTHGRKNTAMMAFGQRLTQSDVELVVDYIRETFMKGPVVEDAGLDALGEALSGNQQQGHGAGGHGAAGGHGGGFAGHRMPGLPGVVPTPEPVDMAAPFPADLVGDFERGRDFYMKNCVFCHGVRGDGLGPRSSFITPKPRNFMHPDSRATLNRPALFKAIIIGKPGTVMPAWGKVLGPQQIADVAEFVFQDFIQPEPALIDDTVAGDDKKKAP